MQVQFALSEVMIPEDKHIDKEYHTLPKSNIFMSAEFAMPDVEKNKATRSALILIQGAGAVRAGIWARSVCVNESLETGSVLPFLEHAKRLKIPVLVMNPNYNRDPVTKNVVPFNNTTSGHAKWVWEMYVKNSGFDQIDIVAHSAGGEVMETIMKEFADTFWSQIRQIAYTDSWVVSRRALTQQ